ncbi:DUF4158 domain-containing protein [Actinokineospora sp.]|uniref:DUF4158 domain-containing protein n=1 Tax=Actinokineospora sp. TaxID=1872133 RepID=UPI004037B168
MRAEWEPDELIGSWTLVEGDWKLIRNKSGATRLGFALLLKFYELEGRFPDGPQAVPLVAVDYVASLVKVDAGEFAKYRWTGRTIEYHRKQIREAFGTRPTTEEDGDRWARWLAEEMCPTETSRQRLAEAPQMPERGCGAADARPGGAGGGVGPFQVQGGVLGGRGGHTGVGGVRQVAGSAGPSACAGGVEVRPGSAGVGHVAGGDREAGDGSVAGAAGRGLLRGVGSDRGGVADAGDADVPVGLRGQLRAGAVHAAGGIVLDAAGRAGRRAGRAADRPDSPDQRAGRAAGGAGAGRRVDEGTGQARHLRQHDQSRDRAPRRHGAGGGVSGGAGWDGNIEVAGAGADGHRAGCLRADPLPAARHLLPPLPADARADPGGVGVQVQQHRLPTGDGRDRLAVSVRGGRGDRAVLRRDRAGADRGRGAVGVAGRGGGRRVPAGRANPVRAVRADRVAGGAAAP